MPFHHFTPHPTVPEELEISISTVITAKVQCFSQHMQDRKGREQSSDEKWPEKEGARGFSSLTKMIRSGSSSFIMPFLINGDGSAGLIP